MTKKLFWDDPNQTKCLAKVTHIKGNKVKLNQTIFYAFSGGQLSDEGTIGGIKVLEAKKEGDKENIIDIEYTLESAPTYQVGDEVEVIIDPVRRSNLRKLHSAAHIVYYITIKELGKLKISGSEVQPEKARMDFEYEGSIVDNLHRIEEDTNKFIAQNHDIIMVPDEKKVDLKWWTCAGWKMPCGGTHVKNTAQIGPLKLKRVNKGKGLERIEIYLTANHNLT
jgi:alanyl-tRNA synthetase